MHPLKIILLISAIHHLSHTADLSLLNSSMEYPPKDMNHHQVYLVQVILLDMVHYLGLLSQIDMAGCLSMGHRLKDTNHHQVDLVLVILLDMIHYLRLLSQIDMAGHLSMVVNNHSYILLRWLTSVEVVTHNSQLPTYSHKQYLPNLQ